MDFLKGYIGLSSTLGTEAESGLYVDALPDITTSTIENLVSNGEDLTEKWSKIEHRTLLKFRTLFNAEVNKCHKIVGIETTECLIKENMSAIATALWYLLGAEVMLERTQSSRTNIATIDRSKPKEIRDYLMEQFKEELTTAVNGIDIHCSSCFEDDECPPEHNIITFSLPIL